jgi:hypothetical protein
MPRDARLYMTFPNDGSLRPYQEALPRGELYTYLVSWPADWATSIVKVGITSRPTRWRQFVSAGADLNLIVRSPTRFALDLERDSHDLLAIVARPAFKSKEQSVPYLRHHGGWTECFEAEPVTAMRAMRVVLDALVQGR